VYGFDKVRKTSMRESLIIKDDGQYNKINHIYL